MLGEQLGSRRNGLLSKHKSDRHQLGNCRASATRQGSTGESAPMNSKAKLSSVCNDFILKFHFSQWPLFPGIFYYNHVIGTAAVYTHIPEAISCCNLSCSISWNLSANYESFMFTSCYFVYGVIRNISLSVWRFTNSILQIRDPEATNI